MAMSETQKTSQSAKDSPFSIRNLLNCDNKPLKRNTFLASGLFEGGFSLSRISDLPFPRFELPSQRFGLSAHYLERTSTWWYPYSLGTSGHIVHTAGRLSHALVTVTHLVPPKSNCFVNKYYLVF